MLATAVCEEVELELDPRHNLESLINRADESDQIAVLVLEGLLEECGVDNGIQQ